MIVCINGTGLRATPGKTTGCGCVLCVCGMAYVMDRRNTCRQKDIGHHRNQCGSCQDTICLFELFQFRRTK